MVTFIVHNFVYCRNLNNGNLGEIKRLCLLGSSGGSSLSTQNNLAVFRRQKRLGTTALCHTPMVNSMKTIKFCTASKYRRNTLS